MDYLQKRHAFDQLEMWLSEVKQNFIERSEEDYNDAICEFESQVADLEDLNGKLEDQVTDLENENEDLKDQVKQARQILESITEQSDHAKSKIKAALNILP